MKVLASLKSAKKRDKNIPIEDDQEGWFVVECKGLKSNAEKHLLRSLSSRTKIYNHLSKKAFRSYLCLFSFKRFG